MAAPSVSTTSTASPLIVEGKATVNGVRYHYLLHKGSGPVVVLLHGWGSTSYMWRFVMPRLSEAGYTVLAPDLRGFGDTDKPLAGYEKTKYGQGHPRSSGSIATGASGERFRPRHGRNGGLCLRRSVP
ncbi:alpha/beta fold hydrolase [Duganella sp. LjRoot269]|uniref:alpha/beta fold hydrolase n=1 Tax=Duganella sp. LjRoot269 TaxID=3342305 RepID=UPI003ED0F749